MGRGDDSGSGAGDRGGPKSLTVPSERLLQLAWVVDCLDDIASDMSAFHRVDDIAALDGPTLFRLAWRLPAYQGVMQVRAQETYDDTTTASPERPPLSSSGSRADAEWNPGLRSTMMADPVLKGIFEFS